MFQFLFFKYYLFHFLNHKDRNIEFHIGTGGIVP